MNPLNTASQPSTQGSISSSEDAETPHPKIRVYPRMFFYSPSSVVSPRKKITPKIAPLTAPAFEKISPQGRIAPAGANYNDR
jgi:hypothetical protein